MKFTIDSDQDIDSITIVFKSSDRNTDKTVVKASTEPTTQYHNSTPLIRSASVPIVNTASTKELELPDISSREPLIDEDFTKQSY